MKSTWLSFGLLALAAWAAVCQPAAAQACPAGLTPTGDGHCLAADQTYCGGGNVCGDGMQCLPGGRCAPANGCFPNEIAVGGGRCAYQGSTVCAGGGTVCPPGTQCSADGRQCFGTTGGTGSCGGYTMQAGHACSNGRAYNPATQKICGTEVCNILAECGQNACLSPYHQQAALTPTPGRPTVRTPQPSPPIVRTPQVADPTVRTPQVTDPTVRTPGASPPTVNVPK